MKKVNTPLPPLLEPLRKTVNALVDLNQKGHTFASPDDSIQVEHQPDGRIKISSKEPPGAGTGTGSGGADNLETVTGAVNGVPSTLKVQTDGTGWAAI